MLIGACGCRFLALERAVPKDPRGRINYWHVAKLINHIVAETSQGPDGQAQGQEGAEAAEQDNGQQQALTEEDMRQQQAQEEANWAAAEGAPQA